MKKYLTNETYVFAIKFITIKLPLVKLFEIDNPSHRIDITSTELDALSEIYKLNEDIIQDPTDSAFDYILVINTINRRFYVTGELIDSYIPTYIKTLKNAIRNIIPQTSDKYIDQIITTSVHHFKQYTPPT